MEKKNREYAVDMAHYCDDWMCKYLQGVNKMEKELREFIWDIYQEYFNTGQTCTKRSECELHIGYPSYSESNFEKEKFLKPITIMFYSYELGPSRAHYFIQKGFEGDAKVCCDTFICDDLEKDFKKIVRGWLDEVKE